MSQPLLDAIDGLTRLIERENTALAAMDLRAAAALSEPKRQAVTTLATLKPATSHDPRLRQALERMAPLIHTNQSLLARGLAAQGRVINLLATAAQSVRAARPGQAARYTVLGRHAAATAPAIAISTRV